MLGCSGQTPEQKVCDRYARTFAEAAAVRCERGSFEENLAAFKSAAGVGEECDLVQRVRDQAALEGECFEWLEKTVDCALFDDAAAYAEALPEACRGQLLVRNP
jgi:hypothetical protein